MKGYVYFKNVELRKRKNVISILLRKIGKYGNNCYIGRRTEFDRYPRGISLGDNVIIGDNNYFLCSNKNSRISIGSDTSLNRNVEISCIDKIEIGSYCLISSDVSIFDSNHSFLGNKLIAKQSSYAKPIKICDDVLIGTKAIILPGVYVGEGSVIGAGSVVTKDVKPYNIVAGNPARVIGSRLK